MGDLCYVRHMKRNAILCGLLVAACGGKSATPTQPLGTSHDTAGTGATQPTTTPSAAVDPALAFRLGLVAEAERGPSAAAGSR